MREIFIHVEEPSMQAYLEGLLRELKRAGHFRGLDRLPKTDIARRMAGSIDHRRNRSQSFRSFLDGLFALVAQIQEAA